jgi:NAD(P)-dependent dehydrogenase (short-subunit alcohol dehydrogenase family)
MDFNGKVAIVTGAASGIGKSIAELYAREGAAVVLSDINQEVGERTTEEIRKAGGEAMFVRADVSKASDCESMVKATLTKYGRLDFACNNAGIGGDQNPTADYSIESWEKAIAVNLSGVFYCMKYQLPAMLRTGGGAIINMASILGRVGFAGAVGYVAAKHGVLGLTKTAAMEYAAQGVRVNVIGPGFISTPLIQELESNPEINNMLISLHPIGRLGRPGDLCAAVWWMSSSRACYPIFTPGC